MSDARDEDAGLVFDQTNGMADGLEGESEGSAEGDEAAPADLDGSRGPRNVGQQDVFHDDWYGEADGTDPNP